MFGSSNPFGQSSGRSPFGPQSLFGQTSNANSIPFGGTSTGVFGVPQASSPFASTTTFGASSSQAFGNCPPAFGASPASTPFGGSSGFGQKPLGFSMPQSNPFGSTAQQSQPACGNSTFGSSTPFGAMSKPAFGASSTPAFGATSTLSFVASSRPAFGASNQLSFGVASTPAFGTSSTPAFGSIGTTFGSTGFGSGGAFGASNTPAFGASGAPAFGATSSPSFATSSTAFGASNAPSFSFGSSSALGQSTSAFGSSAYGSTPSPFGAQGAQASTPTFGGSDFGQSPFGGQQGGSRVVPYAPTIDTGNDTQPAGTLESISAMPAYKDKSHEELRWEDYQRGDKGGPLPVGQSPGNAGFGVSTAQKNHFSPSLAFGQTSANPTNPFSSSTSTNPFVPQTPTLTSSGFGAATSNFGSSPAFGQFGQSSASAFGQSNLFNKPSNGFGNMFSSCSTLTTSSSSPFGQQTMPAGMTPFQSVQPIQASYGFGFNHFGQAQAANPGGLGFCGQGNFGQSTTYPSSVVLQPVVANPFGILPAMPQISIHQSGNSSSIQYGFSSKPVVEKCVPIRISSLLTSRRLLPRRARLQARKYRPGDGGPRVPFLTDDEMTSSTPKADAFFIPRENPRALVIRPVQHWSSRRKLTLTKDRPTAPVLDIGKSPDMGTDAANHDKSGKGEPSFSGERTHHPSVNACEKERPYKSLSGHRDGEAETVKEHSADIETLMPKLHQSDYFTNPPIQELAAKERADPGYCRRVRDFVVGRHGYGFIKFMGETDVRRLDLESLVQFNNREVTVYMDASNKPAVGEGLNKPAEVTLLNIKCVEKKTWKQLTEGEKVDKYKMMLKKKAEEQGAEFVSYDPVKGEWKFRVDHFSCYKLVDEDDHEV